MTTFDCPECSAEPTLGPFESPVPPGFTPTTTTVTAVSPLAPLYTVLPSVKNNTYCQTVDHIIPPLPNPGEVTCGINAYFRNATNIMRGCCYGASILVDDSGCALYCTVTSDQYNQKRADGADVTDCIAQGTGRDICRLGDGTVEGIYWPDYTPPAYSTLSSTTASAAATSATATPGLASMQKTASASRVVAVVLGLLVAGHLLEARY